MPLFAYLNCRCFFLQILGIGILAAGNWAQIYCALVNWARNIWAPLASEHKNFECLTQDIWRKDWQLKKILSLENWRLIDWLTLNWLTDTWLVDWLTLDLLTCYYVTDWLTFNWLTDRHMTNWHGTDLGGFWNWESDCYFWPPKKRPLSLYFDDISLFSFLSSTVYTGLTYSK